MSNGLAFELRGAQVRRDGLSADPGADTTVVLNGVDLALERGGRLVLLGPSGGGKTSVLRLLNSLATAESGAVEVLGRSAEAWPIGELRRKVVFVPQAPQLLTSDGSAREELLEPLRWRGRQVSDAELSAALGVVGLELELGRAARELSGGQLARLGLARALLLEPELLLLDEPTAALDVRTARELLARLKAWAEERGVTLVVVSHAPVDAASLGAQACVLLEGRVRGPFAGDALARGEVEDAEVAAFLGSVGAEAEAEAGAETEAGRETGGAK